MFHRSIKIRFDLFIYLFGIPFGIELELAIYVEVEAIETDEYIKIL
jgi:hypothetical protein